VAKQRAVYLANLAACDIGRGDHAEALRACSAAIEEDPTYIKVGGSSNPHTRAHTGKRAY